MFTFKVEDIEEESENSVIRSLIEVQNPDTRSRSP